MSCLEALGYLVIAVGVLVLIAGVWEEIAKN